MVNMANMQKMMKQAQKMQAEMQKEQEAIQNTIFEAQDNNGLVKAKVNGQHQIVELEIQEALVDPEDIEMLQDLVLATINEALAQVDEATETRLGKYTQGLNLPF